MQAIKLAWKKTHLGRAGVKPYYVPKFLHLSKCIHTTDLPRKLKSGYLKVIERRAEV